jgi:GT2 family glycosyltransferase
MESRIPIFVGVPVYRGWDFLDESLRSIRDQTFENFRVLISVDGGDERSAQACARYTDDSRFQVVVQAERLGWARNLNWLMSQSDGEFFCYWPQDDFCTTSYFQVLYDYATDHAEAACVYTDLQCVGSRMDRIESPSLTGFALLRVLEQIEGGYFVPFRGLIRRSALAAAGPLRVTEYDSCLEDLIWLAKVAREGELHRVPGALYFKREHRGSVHSHWFEWSKERRRAAWIEWGLAMLEVALPLVPPVEYGHLIKTVLDRLMVPQEGRRCGARPRPDRWLFYNPSITGAVDLICSASDFVGRAKELCGLKSVAEILGAAAKLDLPALSARRKQLDDDIAFSARSHFTEASFGNRSGERMLIEVILREMWFEQLSADLERESKLETHFAMGQPGTALLQRGWSTPESWGVWSDGPASRLRLCIPRQQRPWRLVLQGIGYAGGLAGSNQRSILVRVGGQNVARHSFTLQEQRIRAEVILSAREVAAGSEIELTFPDAVSPLETECGADPRRLGFGLQSLIIDGTD